MLAVFHYVLRVLRGNCQELPSGAKTKGLVILFFSGDSDIEEPIAVVARALVVKKSGADLRVAKY